MFFLVLSEMIPESRANDAEHLTSALAAWPCFFNRLIHLWAVLRDMPKRSASHVTL